MNSACRSRRARPVLLALLATLIAAAAASPRLGAQQVGGPLADFELSADSGLAPLLVSVSNRSSGAERFHWDFGDGATSSEREPAHLYVRPGLFVVELEACAMASCASAIRLVNVEGRDALDGGTILGGSHVYGSINQPGDVDEWTFEGVAGSLVDVTMEPDTGSPVDPVLRLFGPDGVLAAFNDDTDESSTATIRDFALPQSGRYTIEAGAFLDTVGVYALSLDVAPADAVRTAFRFRPATGVAPLTVTFLNDTRNATRFLWDFGDGGRSERREPVHQYAAGGVYSVSLTACRGDDCDVARGAVAVEANDGGAITPGEPLNNRVDFEDDVDRFTFAAPAGAELMIDLVAADDALDTLLFLFGPDGEQIATDDDGGAGTNARIANLILSETGTYAIDAQAFPGGGTGAYTLSLTIEPEPLVRAAVAVDATSFVVPVEVTFRDVSLGGPTTRTWRLHGTEIGMAAAVPYLFEEAGAFTVELESCNERSCDRWSVQIRVTSELDGGPIAPNQTVFGAIDKPGDVDDWTFAGVEGDIVTVAAIALDEEFDVALELLTEAGMIVAFDDDSGGDLNPLIDGVALPSTGEFTIRMRSFDETGTGRYRLELALVRPGPAAG